MEAKLPRSWCNPLRVTTSTSSSLCPTVLQTSFLPPICSLHATVSHHHHHHHRDAGFFPHTVLASPQKRSTTSSRAKLFWSQVRPEICQVRLHIFIVWLRMSQFLVACVFHMIREEFQLKLDVCLNYKLLLLNKKAATVQPVWKIHLEPWKCKSKRLH